MHALPPPVGAKHGPVEWRLTWTWPGPYPTPGTEPGGPPTVPVASAEPAPPRGAGASSRAKHVGPAGRAGACDFGPRVQCGELRGLYHRRVLISIAALLTVVCTLTVIRRRQRRQRPEAVLPPTPASLRPLHDTPRRRLRVLGWALLALGPLAALLLFLDANTESGAADTEQMYCAQTIYTDGDTCDMNATHQMKQDKVMGGIALGVAALGGLIVYLSPREALDRRTQEPSKPATNPRRTTSQKFQELDNLQAAGAITEDEYAAARKRILDDI